MPERLARRWRSVPAGVMRGQRRALQAGRRGIEQLESRVLFAATTVFADAFEGSFLNGWTNRTGEGANPTTRWGLNSTKKSAGNQSAFASAVAGGVTARSGYQNNQHNTLVRQNLSLAGFRVAELKFDYFLNSENGYDTFSVAVTDANDVRTTLFSESGNYASAGWRTKTLDLGAFAGRTNLDLEFRFETDSSVTQDGGGVWVDELRLTADSVVPPGSISGKLFEDADGDKVRDSGEGALANWLVYLDQNRNGARDVGELSTRTDTGGNYSFTNLAPGTYYVAEEVGSGFSQTSPGASGLSSGSFFKIDVNFPDSSLTLAQRAAFTEAANRWAQIIVGDVPDVSDNGTTIDDIRITATAPSIDGRGGVLGQAAPSGFRTGSTLPYKGFMEFDRNDLAQLEADGQLTRVILHEMGHVLGFGTIWGAKNLLQGGGGGGDPRYTGPSATTQYNTLFGSTGANVPVENGGAPGTYDSHWRESTFGNELMTGYLNGGANPLSRITVGAMADLGYAVSYSAADAYAKPATSTLNTVAFESAMAAVSAKVVKDEAFYGEMNEEDVVVSALNSTAALAPAAQPTLLGFAHTVYVDTGVARTGIDFGNRRSASPAPSPTPTPSPAPTGNRAPTIGSAYDTPDYVAAGTTVSLVASNVADPDGSIASVAFYRETNGAEGLQTTGASPDTLVGTDASAAGGYSVSFSTAGQAVGSYRYYARATDNAGAASNVVSTNNRITSSPAPTPLPTPTPAPTPTPTPAAGTITGTVFNDLNGNAARDAGEPGQSGWRVFVDANKNSRLDAGEPNVLTGSTGAYTFTGLSAGTHNIREVDQTGWARTAFSPNVTLAAGQSAANQNFPNFQNASITGRVFHDADNDGTPDAGEPGLASVLVYDDKNNNGLFDSGERSTTTDANGNYTLATLVAGQRTVRIVVPNGRSLNSPSLGYHRLTPTSGQAVTGKHFATRTTSSLAALGEDDLLTV